MAQLNGPRRPGLIIGAAHDPERRSVVGSRGELLLHADLHNHTRLSDGEGWAEDAFASMRDAGLDVAAITDHTYGICEPSKTIDETGWRLLGKLADDADELGRFVAMRGFEWSSPSLGHMNVWGSRGLIEPLPLVADGVPAHLAITDAGPVERPLAVTAFYDWLATSPEAMTPDADAPLIGFNHPGREPDRFGIFHLDRRLLGNLVALEMFNRDEDYLFEGTDSARTSPLVECLDTGWRPGLIGVTDEHGAHWGFPTDLGRTGIWANERSRAGVRQAMLARRMFATRERGLRADAICNGTPMGAHLTPVGDEIELRVDLDSESLHGRSLRLQCLSSGHPLPEIALEFDFTVTGDVVTFTLAVDQLTSSWLVIRVTDPARPADRRAGPHPAYARAGQAIAYLSPFYLHQPDTGT